MKQFDEAFRTQLYETIEKIENDSLVEVVAIIKAGSAPYKDISLWAAFLTMSVLYTFFMFAPIDFSVYLMYFFTILSFPTSFFLFEIMPGLKRKFVPKQMQDRQVDIYSRAVFQKGGVRHTEEKIGVLFYVSLFEKQVRIVADRGAEMSVPQEDWLSMQVDFDKMFSSENKAVAFLESLDHTREVFAQYIPPVENDINELPDNLEVDF